MENKEMGERTAAIELVRHIVLFFAAEKGGRQEMELQELASHDEFVIEQLHIFEEKITAGKKESIFDQVREVIEDILHNKGGRVR